MIFGSPGVPKNGAGGKNLELQIFDRQSKMWIERVLFAATIDKGTTTEAYQIKDEVPILLLCWKILGDKCTPSRGSMDM